MSANDDAVIDDLVTIRDWWRYGTSTFSAARLVFGHGTTNATDEAAFLILSALNLPIDVLEPWLDCRLTQPERVVVRDMLERRVTTRKPASYLTNSAWIQGRKFYVDERVIIPRSFIGELLCHDRLATAVGDPDAVTCVLDLCTGSGCLAILAAEAFPDATIDASDLSEDALVVARRNITDYDLSNRIQLHRADVFDGIPARKYDVIIANPPYVRADEVEAFDAEYKAEPQMAHLGGKDGLDLVHRILVATPDFLTDNGTLIVEIGTGRETLEAARPDLPFLWLDTETSEGEVFALPAADLNSNHKKAPKSKRGRA